MLTVLTVTIPGRENLLLENVRSVYAQTSPVAGQLIATHQPRDNPQVQYSAAKNDLLGAVDTPWVAVLNDDDLWLAHHLETILPHLDDADVVYTWDANGHKPRVDCNDWTREQLVEFWERDNFLDGNCAIRVDALKDVGGFPVDWVGPGPRAGGHYENSVATWEDWELWRRLVRVGARFRCVPVETWRYGLGTPGQLCG